MGTVLEMRHNIMDVLTPLYGEGEARAMMRLIFYHLKSWKTTDLIIHEGDELSGYMESEIKGILNRLLMHEPIQYVLGQAYFYGMYLKVNPGVLIPRPETEELVTLIVNENPGTDLRVLDIGTGSGAIAIALSRHLNFPRITAIDISSKALDVAVENARDLKADIDFIKDDIFVWQPSPGLFDIIVSNPPYITESEMKEMESNVLDYEPHTALFVPDENPLVFYSRISTVATEALVSGGRLYFEINPLFADKLKSLLAEDGFRDIEVTEDAYHRKRFISCSKP